MNGSLIDQDNSLTPVKVHAGLQLSGSNKLCLAPLNIEGIPGLGEIDISPFDLDLGSDVAIESFSLKSAQLLIEGKIMVRP